MQKLLPGILEYIIEEYGKWTLLTLDRIASKEEVDAYIVTKWYAGYLTRKKD